MKPLSKLNPAVTYSFNILNVIALRDHLIWINKKTSKPKIGFNMSTYYSVNCSSATDSRKDFSFHNFTHDKSGHKCGTIACIAGHACILANQGTVFYKDFTIFTQAQNWLNLTHSEAVDLFHGKFQNNPQPDIYNITLEEAIAALDYMIETGKVHD